MVSLNLMLPNYFFEYIFIAYITISFIEGIFVNFALQQKWHHRQGLVIGAVMNLISSVAGLLININFPELSDDVFETFFTACLISTLIEYSMVTLWFSAESRNRTFMIYIASGNIITYTLLWSSAFLLK